jgi:transposase
MFGGQAPLKIVLEAGSQSAWMCAELRELGHQVQVADPRKVALIAKSNRKTDQRDSEVLARLGMGAPELIGEVHHRSLADQADVAMLRARDRDPELSITKTGDGYLRRLLVQSAQYMLGPFGQDSDLRRFGLRLAARGGKGAKRGAVVAVARKLAVLLHRLWVTDQPYDPVRQAKRLEGAAKN